MRRSVIGLDHHEVVGLEIYLENEYETHLRFGWQNFYGVLHQNIFFRFFFASHFRVRIDSLHCDFHLKLLNGVLLARVHESEKYPELLTSAYFSERRVVIQCSLRLDTIIGNVIRSLQFVSLGILKLVRSGQRYHSGHAML